MKKTLALLLAAMMALLPFAAQAENWYIAGGMQLANRLHTLAGDKNYISLFSDSAEIQALAAEFAASDLSAPAEAQMLFLRESGKILQLLSLLGTLGGEPMPEFSETVTAEIYRGLPGMLVSLVNGRVGSAWIAAASILTTSETHIMPEDFQPGVLLLEYPGSYSVAIAFSRTGSETVTATATPVPSGFIDSLSEDLDGAAKLFFGTLFQTMPLQ